MVEDPRAAELAEKADEYLHDTDISPRDRRAGYEQSLSVLERASRESDAYTKTGVMLGVGEYHHEVYQTMRDLRGKTTGKIHDRKVAETGDPVITIGFGPDFAVLRSDGVRLDIPETVAELKADVEGAGVSGGGHLVVGSIRFVSGMREEVIEALVEKMADAEIDEELGSSAVMPEEA